MERVLEIKASQDEIIQIIQEFCKKFDYSFDKQKLIVKTGRMLGLHPENSLIKIKISCDYSTLKLESSFFSTWFTRKKMARIAQERLVLLEDYIKHRLGGNLPEKFHYSGYESGFSRPIFYAWIFSSFVMSLIATTLILTIFCMSVIDFNEIAQRSKTLYEINKIALPNSQELAKVDLSFKLGSGFLLSIIISFFIAFIYSLTCALGEFSKRFGNVNFTVLIFIGAFIFVSFATALPIYSAFIAAIFVPTFTHLGYSIFWGLKKEIKTREKKDNRLAIAFIILLLLTSIPIQTDTDLMLANVASRRDMMLNNPVGKTICDFYYTHTPYVSQVFKELFTDDKKFRKQQTTCFALVDKTEDIKSRLEKLEIYVDYAYEEGNLDKIKEKEYDFYLVDEKFSSAISLLSSKDKLSRAIIKQKQTTPDWLKSQLKQISNKHFRTRFLRELAATGWFCTYYFGSLCVIFGLSSFLFIIMKLLHIKNDITLKVTVIALVALGVYNLIDKSYPVEKPDIKNLDQEALRQIITHTNKKGLVKWDTETKEQLKTKIIKLSIGGNTAERMYSCELMGLMGDKSLYSYLIRALDDKEFYVKYKAIDALSKLGVTDAIKHIETIVKKESWYVGGYALDALRELKPYHY